MHTTTMQTNNFWNQKWERSSRSIKLWVDGVLTVLKCICGRNLEILSWTGDELTHGQAQNGVNFDFEVKFDLEGHGQSPPKTTGILTKVFYIYGPNLVILAWTGVELSRGQASDYRMDGHTDRRRQRQYPKAKTGLG